MKNLPMRWVVPAVMVPLFGLSLWRAERSLESCNSDDRFVCFPFPLYLQTEVAQGIDLSWPGLVPAALVVGLPGSINPVSQGGRAGAAHLAAVTLGVTLFWFVIGLWWDRLRLGQRLQGKIARGSLIVALGVLGPLMALSLYLRMRGGYEGPTITDASVIPALMLVTLGLIELRVFAALFQRSTVRIMLAGLMVVLYVVAEAKYQQETAEFEKEEEIFRFSDALPRHATEVVDALALQGPALVAVLMPAELSLLPVFIYWFAIISLIAHSWPSETQLYGAIRPWLRGAFALTLLIVLLGWLTLASLHGYLGGLGAMAGCSIVIYALRPGAKLSS